MDVIADKSKFIEDLELFMTRIGRPIGKSPVMGYKELDLHQLFCEVMAHGGFAEVVKKVGTWAKIWKHLDNFDASVTDASYRLKKNYERCLLEYETKRFQDLKDACLASINAIQAKVSANSSKKVRSSNAPRKSTNDAVPSAPFRIGDITIESLGTIIPKSPYVNNKFIYPVGFVSSRMFPSMVNPKQLVKYICQIVDNGNAPRFVVIASDEPTTPLVDESPSKVWKLVSRRINLHGDMLSKLSGKVQFGLTHPIVKRALQEMPNADKALELFNSLKNKKRTIAESSSSSESGFESPLPKSPKLTSSSSRQLSRSSSAEELVSPPEKVVILPTLPVAFNFNMSAREDMDDLEIAVQTLTSLKFLHFSGIPVN